MFKTRVIKYFTVIQSVLVILTAASCKKDNDSATPASAPVNSLATLGLYQYGSGQNKRVFIAITQLGTQKVNYASIFDTGSSGMTIDADGILPASMITTSGIQFAGDSIEVNGITVTKKTGIMSYGDQISSTKEYGNVAYATMTLGDSRGTITTKRIPFFLYYKIVDEKGKQLPAHAADVFGVGPGTSYASTLIASPLSYFTMPANVTNGFKLGALTSTAFNSAGTYVAGLLTIGLVPNDLTSAGFIMHPLSYSISGGYSPNIPATITYNGQTVNGAQVLFDTGTPSVSTIESRTASALGALPANSVITILTNKGFRYQYTTSGTSNLTEIQNPNNTGDYRTIFSIDFFVENLYLTDYTNHQIGLRNR